MAAVNKNKLLDNATKYIQKGQVDRAIKELQKVVEADPADARTRLKLATPHNAKVFDPIQLLVGAARIRSAAKDCRVFRRRICAAELID